MPLRVGTYNLQNLFLAGEGEPQKSARALLHLARTIARIDADVLCVQEVGSYQSLVCLNDALKVPYPWIGLLPGNSDRSIHLGYLSRRPLTLTSHRDRLLRAADGSLLRDGPVPDNCGFNNTPPLRLQRDILLARLQLPTSELVLLNVHLKSRTGRTPPQLSSDELRRAEATMLAMLVRELQQQNPHILLLVAGDFNDTWHSDALAPVRQLGLHDPLREMLRQAGRNPSTYWPKRRNRIDYVLLNDNLAPSAGDAEIGVHVQARVASDHYPVVQQLNLDA